MATTPPQQDQAMNGSLHVSLADDVYWPQPVRRGDAEIEVFPLVTALVVDRPGGDPLTRSDRAASEEAVKAFCRDRGQRSAPLTVARWDSGTWMFPPCLP
jgi:hypothetical protein